MGRGCVSRTVTDRALSCATPFDLLPGFHLTVPRDGTPRAFHGCWQGSAWSLASEQGVCRAGDAWSCFHRARDLEQIDFQSRWVPPWVSFGSLLAQGAASGSRIWPSSPSRDAAGLGMLLQRGCQKVYSPWEAAGKFGGGILSMLALCRIPETTWGFSLNILSCLSAAANGSFTLKSTDWGRLGRWGWVSTAHVWAVMVGANLVCLQLKASWLLELQELHEFALLSSHLSEH